MKLRATAGVCILAAIVAAGLWDLQRSSAQVAADPASASVPASSSAQVPAGAAPAPAPSPVQTTADVFISAPRQPVPTSANVLPGQPVPPPAYVPGLEPLQAKIFKYQGNDSGVAFVHGISDKIIHLKSKGGNRQAADALRQAAAALRDAKDDAAKTAAQGQLTELLDKVFEEDMQRREQELAQVEQRTKDLRALMGRRREKKNEIVDLQIKVLLNEADGLGFFNEAPMPVPNKAVEVRHLLSDELNPLAPRGQSISTTSSDSVTQPVPVYQTSPAAIAPAR